MTKDHLTTGMTTEAKPAKTDMIWEVYAALALSPMQAVDILWKQEICVTPLEALREIRQARRRNTLKLVRF